MLKFMCLSALALCVISHPLGPEKTGHVEEVSKYHSTELNHPKFNRPSPINPDIPSDPKPSDDVKISVLSEDEKHKLSENKPVSPSSFHEHEQSDSYGARIAPTTEAPKHKRSPDHIEGHDEKHDDSHHDSHEHEHKVDDHKKGYFPEYNSQPQVKLASEHDDDPHVDHDHHDDHHNDHDHHEHHDHDNNHHERHTEDVKANSDKSTLQGSAPAVKIENQQPVEAVPVHENKARITREEAKPTFASGPQINVKPPFQGPSSNQKPQINVKPPTQRSKRESEKSTVTTSAAPVTENTKSEVKSVSNTAAKTTVEETKTEVSSGTQINVKPLPSESETETEPPCDLGPEDDDEPSTQSSGTTSAPVSGNAKTEAKSESSTAKATEEESKPKVTSDTQTDDEASPDCDLEPEKKDEPSPKRTKRAYGDCPCRSKTKNKKTYPRKRVQPQYNLLPSVPRRKRDTTSSSGDKIAPVVTVSSFSQTWTREPQNPPAVEAAHHETTSTTTERHRRRRGVDETESQDDPTTAKPTRAWWRSIDPDRVKSEPAPSTAPPAVKAIETVKAHEVTTDKNEKHKRDTKDEKDSETTSTTVKYNRPSEPAEPVYDSKPPTFVHPVPVAQILGSRSDQHAQTHHEDKASAESASSSEEGKSVENKPKHETKEAEKKAN